MDIGHKRRKGIAVKRLYAVGLFLSASLSPSLGAESGEPDRAVACPFYGRSFRGPDRPAETIDHLIERTNRIVVGFVVGERLSEDSWTGVDVVFKVQINSTLKGDDSMEPIEVVGVRREHPFVVDPYLLDLTYRHSLGLARAKTVAEAGSYTSAIYDAGIGANPKGGARCEHVPALEVGMTYLMFLGEPVTEVSYEPIVNFADDPWLNRIRTEVTKRQFENMSGDR
jgi:hypothetical protein